MRLAAAGNAAVALGQRPLETQFLGCRYSLASKKVALRSAESARVVDSEQIRRGRLRSLCIKIGCSEPTRAESREGTSGLAESSRVM